MTTVTLPVVAPELELRRDHAIAALSLQKRITLQGAADELAAMMNPTVPTPGGVVPGPSVADQDTAR